MATQIKDVTKIDQNIRDLELEEIDIDRKLLAGTISQREAQEKKTELSQRLNELTQQKQAAGTSQTTEEKSNEKEHRNSGHPQHAPHKPETTTEESSIDGADTAETADKLLKQRSKILQTAQAATSTGTHTYKWFYKYTPLGFIYGKLSPRIKEREFAKRATSQMQRASQRMKNLPKKAAKKGAHWYMKYTPLGFALRKINNKLPKKIKDPHQKIATSIRKRRSATEYEKAWNDAALKRTISQRLKNSEKISKLLRSRGWNMGKYFIPVAGSVFASKSVKNVLQRRDARNRADEYFSAYKDAYQRQPDEKKEHQATPQVSSRTKTLVKKSGKTVWKGYSKAYSYSPVGQAWTRWGQPRTISLNRRLGNRFGNGAAKQAGKRAAQKMGTQLAKTLGKQAVLTFLKTPIGWVTIGIIAAILLFITLLFTIITLIMGGGGGENTIGGTTPPGSSPVSPPQNNIPGLSLILEGPTAIPNSQNIVYTVRVSYNEALLPGPIDSINIINTLPNATRFTETTGVTSSQTDGAVVWPLSAPQNRSQFTFTLSPLQDNIVINNFVYATVLLTSPNDSSGIFPPSDTTPEQDALKQNFANLVASKPDVVSVYKQASAQTGISWEVLAGLHNFETGGGIQMDRSLVSGRPIGGNEPDVVRAGGCTENSEPGRPVPVPGGCGFKTLLDSAIYAGNLLAGKNNGNVPSSFEQYVKATSYYNGGGNANCDEGLPYQQFCPPAFIGDDDPYAMNKFDRKHDQMYLLYCADFTRCNPPELIARIGIMTAADALSKYYNL